MKKIIARMKELDFWYLPTSHTTRDVSFILKALKTCTHVRVDRIKKALEAPYTGLFLVLLWFYGCFKLQYSSGKTDMVSTDSLNQLIFFHLWAFRMDVPLQEPPSTELDGFNTMPSFNTFECSGRHCLYTEEEIPVRRYPKRRVTFSNKKLCLKYIWHIK